jgi:DNA (cytosine-5)-methyltransferase 1
VIVLSLFPGLGLLDRAFELEGYCTVRGPDVIWGGDIRTFHPPAGLFDGVIGGPPCQTFSALANLVRAKGLEPAFGNLIPEFERVVSEAEPLWFLMENVRAAPLPVVPGYAVTSFILDNAWLGEEQMRKRRFSFGLRGDEAPNLRKWIPGVALELPYAALAVQGGHDHLDGGEKIRARRQAVCGDNRAVPVALGGSGKVKRRTVRGVNNLSLQDDPRKVQRVGVTGAHPCHERPKGGHGERYTLAEMCELQGLPADYLDHCPMTVQGKRKAIGNGVPIQLGRAVAQAIQKALAARAGAG